MKKLLVLLAAVLLQVSVMAQVKPRIAVLEFNAGSGVRQADVDGLSAMFNTCFNPTGYTLVERTQVSRILQEQRIQVSRITEKELAELGRIMNVPIIIIGDVNYAMRQYNVDVRAVNVETGEIVAKGGTEWAEGSSYRQMMCKLAEQIAERIPEVKPLPTPPKKEPIGYRPAESSIRFSAGVHDVLFGIAYNHFFTSSFMLGGGIGIGPDMNLYNPGYYRELCWEWGDPALPVFLEAELRTPRYEWSVFLNVKAGYRIPLAERHVDREYHPAFATFMVGAGFRNLSLGVGVSTNPFSYMPAPLVFSLSYNLPTRVLRKAFM